MGYMKDFLFTPEQARTAVEKLSGGERGRLALARLLALPSNVLVLDEPTNDLDLETLDLLQEMLGDYPGTVIVVSHDRDFLDRVATSMIVAEGEGVWTEYAGGYSDMVAQRGFGVTKPERRARRRRPAAAAPSPWRRSHASQGQALLQAEARARNAAQGDQEARRRDRAPQRGCSPIRASTRATPKRFADASAKLTGRRSRQVQGRGRVAGTRNDPRRARGARTGFPAPAESAALRASRP